MATVAIGPAARPFLPASPPGVEAADDGGVRPSNELRSLVCRHTPFLIFLDASRINIIL